MPIEIKEEPDDRFVTITVHGKLVKDDYLIFMPQMEALLQRLGSLRVLCIMTDFHGFDAQAAWEDLKFGVKHSSDIAMLAVVGDRKWEEWMTRLWAPFMKGQVRYFGETQIEDARVWLRSAVTVPEAPDS